MVVGSQLAPGVVWVKLAAGRRRVRPRWLQARFTCVGLFVPKPSTDADCQRRSIPGLGQTVRGCPLASTAVRGDCHLLLSLSRSRAGRERLAVPTRFPSLRLCVQPRPPPSATCTSRENLCLPDAAE